MAIFDSLGNSEVVVNEPGHLADRGSAPWGWVQSPLTAAAAGSLTTGLTSLQLLAIADSGKCRNISSNTGAVGTNSFVLAVAELLVAPFSLDVMGIKGAERITGTLVVALAATAVYCLVTGGMTLALRWETSKRLLQFPHPIMWCLTAVLPVCVVDGTRLVFAYVGDGSYAARALGGVTVGLAVAVAVLHHIIAIVFYRAYHTKITRRRAPFAAVPPGTDMASTLRLSMIKSPTGGGLNGSTGSVSFSFRSMPDPHGMTESPDSIGPTNGSRNGSAGSARNGSFIGGGSIRGSLQGSPKYANSHGNNSFRRNSSSSVGRLTTRDPGAIPSSSDPEGSASPVGSPTFRRGSQNVSPTHFGGPGSGGGGMDTTPPPLADFAPWARRSSNGSNNGQGSPTAGGGGATSRMSNSGSFVFHRHKPADEVQITPRTVIAHERANGNCVSPTQWAAAHYRFNDYFGADASPLTTAIIGDTDFALSSPPAEEIATRLENPFTLIGQLKQRRLSAQAGFVEYPPSDRLESDFDSGDGADVLSAGPRGPNDGDLAGLDIDHDGNSVIGSERPVTAPPPIPNIPRYDAGGFGEAFIFDRHWRYPKVPNELAAVCLPCGVWVSDVRFSAFAVATAMRPRFLRFTISHNILRILFVAVLAAYEPPSGTPGQCALINLSTGVFCLAHALLALACFLYRVPLLTICLAAESACLGLYVMAPVIGESGFTPALTLVIVAIAGVVAHCAVSVVERYTWPGPLPPFEAVPVVVPGPNGTMTNGNVSFAFPGSFAGAELDPPVRPAVREEGEVYRIASMERTAQHDDFSETNHDSETSDGSDHAPTPRLDIRPLVRTLSSFNALHPDENELKAPNQRIRHNDFDI